MNKNKILKNIKINLKFNLIFLFIFFLIFISMNYLKSNLIYAGQIYSNIKLSNSSEKLFDSSEKKIEILRYQIKNLSIKINSTLEEITQLENSILFHLKIKNKNNPNESERNSSFLKFQISFLKNKKSFLKKQLNEMNLEKIDLEIELRKKIKFFKKINLK
ncbi:effector protein [Candidatus Phytoplasma oryzae]|nr:effector protein [Candidatus Phytoplasma oryzae]